MQLINNMPSQFTNPYNINDHSQCSWFTMEVVNNRNTFMELINKNDFDQYKNLVHQCLKEGTRKRLENKKYPLGENIDQVIGSENYKYFVCESSKVSLAKISEFITEYTELKRDYEKINEDTLEIMIVEEIKKNNYIMVNRHGESFTVLSDDNLKYNIIDSHKTIHRNGSIKDVMKYILDDYYDFYYILIGILN